MIQPFRPRGAVRRTCNALRGEDSKTYVGLEDSGSMCEHAAKFSSYFARPLKSESYQCPASMLPFEYPNWNPKWYSPLCRGWYKASKLAGNRGIVSDPYMMAQVDHTEIGITPCMPIL